MKRWIAVAAAGLAVLSGIVTQGPARASSAAWYQVYQSGSNGWFSGIAAISKNNVWAVGDTFTASGKTVYTPFIRHFNGSSWQAITIPNGSGSTADWVSASASNNVWVGGLNNNPSLSSTVAYRWNGARWGKVPVPAQTFLQGVLVLAPNNVWAFGNAGLYDILHWNGSGWQHYLPDTTNFVPEGISASAANNVWVSGFAFSGSKEVVAAYRWNGSAWRPVGMPHPALISGAAVTAVSPSNVWVGYDASSSKSYALHWNGSRWSTVTAPYYANTSDVVPDGKSGYWFGAGAILTGSTWANVQIPGFSGGFGGVSRVLGTTSFLLPAGVETGSSSIENPTLFRFDL